MRSWDLGLNTLRSLHLPDLSTISRFVVRCPLRSRQAQTAYLSGARRNQRSCIWTGRLRGSASFH